MVSRAAMMAPSSVMIRSVREPSMASWANLMPSTRLSLQLMRPATSSVVLTAVDPMAMNCLPPSAKKSSISWSALWMAPTVVMPNTPRCERTSSGCGSVSLMQPMPLAPWKSARSPSNFVRNGEFSME